MYNGTTLNALPANATSHSVKNKPQTQKKKHKITKQRKRQKRENKIALYVHIAKRK